MNDRQYTSEAINDIATALALAQAEMKHAGKSADNPFFKSRYADLPAVIDAARPALTKNNLSVVQFTDVDEAGKTFLVTQLSHSSGQWMRSWYPVNPVRKKEKDKQGNEIGILEPSPQDIGSALTYARRYAYGCITGVAATDEDDDGNAASGNHVKPTAIANKKKFDVVKKALQESDDPAFTWGQNLAAINEFLEQDKSFYDDLVSTGRIRKEQLSQDMAMKAGMPQGFNDTKGE